jgi:hypothetical protein
LPATDPQLLRFVPLLGDDGKPDVIKTVSAALNDRTLQDGRTRNEEVIKSS